MCISQPEWLRHFDALPGTGTGAVISVLGYLYFFDLSLSDCISPVSASDIYWSASFKADECPTACPDIQITWTGSVTYRLICCYDDALATWNIDNAGTLTQSGITVEATNLCFSVLENSPLETPVAGASCGSPYLLSIADENARVRFALSRDVPNELWVLLVSGSGTIPAQVPNEIGGTGWFLRYTALLTDCPPQDGWTLDSEGSTLPILNTGTCVADGYPYPGATYYVEITNITPGSVSIAYV